MKKLRVIALLLVMLSVCAVFVGCSNKPEDYYNDNKLIANGSNFIKQFAGYNYSKGELKYEASKVTGCEQVGVITIESHSEFIYDLKITSGKFKLVIVSSADVVYTVFETDGVSVEDKMTHFPAGTYKVKVVALEATGVDLNMHMGTHTH